jgi:predicted outer membrane repeat protein
MANAADSAPTVTGSTFFANSAIDGGGMLNIDGSTPVVSDCLFDQNIASNRGGGMACREDSPATVLRCRFAKNDALIGGGLVAERSSVVVEDTVFARNTASQRGGAVAVSWDPARIDRCTMQRNVTNGGGGGIDLYGSDTIVSNTVFAGNTAGSGGGMSVRNSSLPFIRNCTFHGNAADVGGGVDHSAATSSLVNCILWDNAGGEIEGTAAVEYSDVRGGAPGIGNVDADPRFVDALGPDGMAGTDDDDLHLAADSPAIDAGDNRGQVGLTPGRSRHRQPGRASRADRHGRLRARLRRLQPQRGRRRDRHRRRHQPGRERQRHSRRVRDRLRPQRRRRPHRRHDRRRR